MIFGLIRKFLRIQPKESAQIAIQTLELLLDLSKLSLKSIAVSVALPIKAKF
jgi:hypothetical protein